MKRRGQFRLSYIFSSVRDGTVRLPLIATTTLRKEFVIGRSMI